MVEAQFGRVKRLAWEVNHGFSNVVVHGIALAFADAAVGWVPNKAMANVAHMHPDLVRASRFVGKKLGWRRARSWHGFHSGCCACPRRLSRWPVAGGFADRDRYWRQWSMDGRGTPHTKA